MTAKANVEVKVGTSRMAVKGPVVPQVLSVVIYQSLLLQALAGCFVTLKRVPPPAWRERLLRFRPVGLRHTVRGRAEAKCALVRVARTRNSAEDRPSATLPPLTGSLGPLARRFTVAAARRRRRRYLPHGGGGWRRPIGR